MLRIGELLCGEELGGLGVHLVGGTFEGSNAEEHKTDEDGDLEYDPDDGPNVCARLGIHY